MEWRFRVSDSGQRLRNTTSTYTKWCPLAISCPQPSPPSAPFPPCAFLHHPVPTIPFFPSQLFDDEISWAYGQVSLGA